jgi:hypothetical protein
MKTFAWLLTLAFVVICISCWGLTSFSLSALVHMNVHFSAFTLAVLHPYSWILFCPVPWVIYSVVLSFRREITPSSVFLFAGTLFFAAAILVCAVVVANVTPWIEVIEVKTVMSQ